jgi:RimJ/RimL family protein N-acetyltransferase
MAEREPPELVVRVYQRADRPQIEAFRCAPYGKKWCVAAQKVIQEAPGAIASGGLNATIAVAAEVDSVIGVVVFGIEPPRPTHLLVYALGVILPRQRQGIGTRLKQAIMAAAASDTNTVSVVESRVHRANYPMIRVNDKLKVGKVKDPDDGEFWMTAVLVEPDYS